MTEIAIYDDLVNILYNVVATKCANVGVTRDELEPLLEDYKSEVLVKPEDTTKKGWYMHDHYLHGLEPYNHSTHEDWPYDYGLTQYIFFGTTAGPKYGYTVKTKFERKGLETGDIQVYDVTSVKSHIQYMLYENGITNMHDIGLPVTNQSIRENIISVSNMYFFTRIVSYFLYRNIRMIVCPDKKKYLYIFAPVDVEPKSAKYDIDHELSYDFKSISVEDQKSELSLFFGNIMNPATGFFVERLEACSYNLSVQYNI